MKNNSILLYYFKSTQNFGDLLNIKIIEKIFNRKVEYSLPNKCDLVAIGSVLGEFLCLKKHRNPDYFYGKYLNNKMNVWGSGFIEPEKGQKEYFIRKMRISALRGRVSLERVIKIDKSINKYKEKIILGDPGLLSSMLIDGKQSKKYKLGIVPHYVDKGDPLIKDLSSRINDSIVIDTLGDPIEVIKKISECETIVSSAMHGLITADSFNIPNVRIKLSDKITGGDYKFIDYYSAYNIEMPEYIDLRKRSINSKIISEIEQIYNIQPSAVNRIRKELISIFPFGKIVY